MPQRFLVHTHLVDRRGCQDLPVMRGRAGVFVWTPFACMMGMCHELDFDLEPDRFAFQFALQGGSCISATSKATIREMPTLLYPARLGTAHLSLQALLGSLQGSGRAYDDESRSVPCGSSSSRRNHCMLPSKARCHSPEPSCKIV